MKLTTWNCRRGSLADKIAALDAPGSDILVLTEASRPREPMPNTLWFGESRYGVAIIARPPYRIDPIVDPTPQPCVYPVRVSGPQSFTLFGIWTWEAPTYKQAFINGLDAYAHLPKPWVMAGDFNGNVCFDRPRGRTKWADCFSRLKAEGLVSAFHEVTGTEHGREHTPTHYFLTHRDRPFHIDYCFIPEIWLPLVHEVAIAPFEEYKSLSDHRPVSFSIRDSGP